MQNAHLSEFKSDESWVILSEIEQQIKAKIEKVGTPLKDWDIQINYGIKTGYNEAFIISGEKKEEILANCNTEKERQKTAEIIRPILRGRDIKRYSYDFADLYLIFVPWHFPLHNDTTIKGASLDAEKEFNKQYPAIYNHLCQHKERLSNRNKAETGVRYEWYALQRWGANYWEEFSRQKILFQELTQGSSFYYDKEVEFMVSNTGYLITGKNLDYLISFLNSKTVEFIFRKFYSISLGDKGLRWLSQYIMNLPIPLIENTEILGLSEEEKELFICKTYNLSSEEIDFIQAQ